MKGKIVEVFESIQGEGIYQGSRQIFLRYYGCNLKCQFCDTKLDSYQEYETVDLVRKIGSLNGSFHSIALTGGEPLLQLDFLKEFLPSLRQKERKIYLETNGTLPDCLSEVIDNIDIIAMDFKLPSSTGLRSFWREHKAFLKIALQKEVFVKAVICQSTVEEDLNEMINLIKEVNRATILVLQPNNSERQALREKLANFKEICRKENVTVCVIPQMHKLIGLK